jgi:hypothetical protein
VIEAAAPPLSTVSPVAGDGNGDGIADSKQNAVVSKPLMLTSQPESATEETPSLYVTLVAASINGKVGASEITQITQITQKNAPSDLPMGVDMPIGLIAFSSTVATPGSSSSFSLYVDSSLSFNGYWKQNQDGIWTNLASPAFGGSITPEGGKLRIDFKIVDGGEFDLDGMADGVITDPGAIGSMPLSIMGMSAERPEGEGWF